MKVSGRIVVVTGAASGIGRALVARFAVEGAKAVVAVDRDEAGVRAVAEAHGAKALAADVSVEADNREIVERTERDVGPIDLFCANAGIFTEGGFEVPDDAWDRIWRINVLAHVQAARAVVPRMLARGGGYMLHTASAAGLLSQIGSAPYAVTKHAAVAFAEWLSITYGDRGLKVSVLCPQAVNTQMTAGTENGGVAGVDGMLEPEQVAETVIRGLEEERFLILPHPQVLEYAQRKTTDYDRWIRGMRRLMGRFLPS
ncbi:MAG: SDR family NAD(P)-dependent oxidoreductase [Deltaproteobacteria bacterium]|nr:SDR family NAD(P)-dependent oxidoreductase [Deltaproteobacteria bacterium]